MIIISTYVGNTKKVLVNSSIQARLHEYVFIENATVLYLWHMVFVSFSTVCMKMMKTIENGKISGSLLFACQENLNNLWLLLHRFQ